VHAAGHARRQAGHVGSGRGPAFVQGLVRGHSTPSYPRRKTDAR
jgi:hypothetical protein